MAIINQFDTIDNTFLNKGIISEGGAGRIFRVEDSEGKEYALKLLKVDERTSRESLKRFKNETNFCINSSHPNIIKIIDRGFIKTDDGYKSPFYVMPIYGSTLRSVINSSIDREKILDIYSHIRNGVEAAHLKEVIHRDLKPENILCDDKDNIVVADFGIAHFTKADLYTLIETKKGTRLANFVYAAPEQKIRDGIIDRRTDIFSLGLILNELFTKEVPQGSNYKLINSVVDTFSFLDEVVEKMISQSKENRPSSVAEVKKLINERSNLFITNQRISKLDDSVIPTSEVSDPIITEPITLVDREWDERSETLTLVLSKNVNDEWKEAFVTLGNYHSLQGKPPNRFELKGNTAKIRAEENEIQPIIDCFKTWLPDVSIRYRAIVESKNQAEEEAYRRQIEEEKERLLRKKRVLENTHI